ncbi:ATP-binding protein [Streptomyces sp. CA2R106]|uniref:ATP-binding protein n=1 Tax=Streptomyces sp. CA2R106 TaxID=3120153 RepID=UPI00300A3C46
MDARPELTLLPRVAWRGQEVNAPRLRALLALLAGELRGGCGTERLVRGLWPEELPERPGKALQVIVSRARAQWGAEVIERTPGGYRLALTEEQVDSSALLLAASTGAERARAGDHAGALAAAETGLALWAEVPDDSHDAGSSSDPVAALRAERRPVRDALARTRALALARLGRYTEAAGPLAQAAAAHPHDEEVLAELLRTQAATAGPSAALTRYEAYRRGLRDRLGTAPGARLRSVQQELLREQTPAAVHGVPHEPNPLLGRDADVEAVLHLLRDARAVTVVGPGGLGKTRLAHAVSRRAEGRVVHFVPLAGVTADQDVAAEVAAALGAGDARHPASTAPASASTAPDPVSGILGALGPAPALLVLDNCEQVVHGAADLVRALVASTRDLRVLATSRAPLDLTSEAVYALPALGPATSAELFTQRARAARPGADLPPDAVAELCRHLDGLPLALELAAARVRALSVPEIARRLGDRFALLRGGARDTPARHRTLHAVVAWSWNLLAEDAAAALRLLSVFPGGFSGAAADHVLGTDALPVLEQLADQSLLTVADTPAGTRFRMLETVREFSAARRAEAGEQDEAADRFLRWARDFGAAHHDVPFGPEPRAAWERIRPEQDNLVLALRHALARGDGATTAAVTAVLAALWSSDAGYARLLTLAADTGPALSHHRPAPEHAEVARAAAVMCTAGLLMGHGPRPLRQLATLRRLPAATPDTLLGAAALVLLAVPRIRPPDFAVLNELCGSDRPLVAGIAESIATYVWEAEHDPDRALASAHRVVTELAPAGSPSMRLVGHSRLSELYLRVGRGEEAYRHLLAVLDVLPLLNDGQEHLFVRSSLVLACLQRGDLDEAEFWLAQCERDAARRQDAHYRPDLAGRAEVALARGETEKGLGLWREVGERMRAGAGPAAAEPALPDPWTLHLQAALVTAHAHAGRLDLAEPQLAELRSSLRLLLAADTAPGASAQLPLYGTALHALGMAGLARGDTAPAVRMLALAERLHVLREFQPTMSADRARRAAANADRAAYRDAVSRYAALARDDLRAAARALVTDRG